MMADTTVLDGEYHQTQSAYALPKDSSDHGRLDVQAAAIREMIGGSPFLGLPYVNAEVQKVVDIGCGTGIATSQLGQLFPSAKVFGLDITPVPETTKRAAPSNVSWITGNVFDVNYESPGSSVLNQEVFARHGFDYVFGRMLLVAVNDWPRYYSIVAESMKSGAILEHQDISWGWYRVGSSERISDDWEWCRATSSALKDAGFVLDAGLSAAKMMERAGLEALDTRTFNWAFTASDQIPESESMAQYCQNEFLTVWRLLLNKLLSMSGYEDKDVERLTQEAVRDIFSEEGLHLKYTVVVARKP